MTLVKRTLRKTLREKKKSADSQSSFPTTFNPLPDDKILDWSKFKQIADDILKKGR